MVASIGQSFITAFPSGTTGAFVTSVEVFFKSVDPVLGCSINILLTQNSLPTQYQIGTVHLTASQVSADLSGQTGTLFTFAEPIYVENNTEYFISVVPDGSNPNYSIWTGVLGQQDVTSGVITQAYTGMGELFTSTGSNWSTVPNESLKFNVNCANFTTGGNSVFTNKNYEFINFYNINGKFIADESVFLQNTQINTAATLYTLVSGSVANGQTLTQNTTTGQIYFTNSSAIFVQNVVGTFTTTGPQAQTATGNISFTSVNQIVTVANTGVVTVPDTSVYSNNQTLIITTQTGSAYVGTANIVSNTQLSFGSLPFSSSNAALSTVVGNGALAALFEKTWGNTLYLTGSTSNSTVNFSNVLNKVIVGSSSGAYCFGQELVNIEYDTVVSQFNITATPQAYSNTSFRGYTLSGTQDAGEITDSLQNISFTDQVRVLYSRTNEILQLANGKSLTFDITFNTQGQYNSPYMTSTQTSATIIRNMVRPNSWCNGQYIYGNNSNLYLTTGTEIQQGNSFAIVNHSNTTCLFVSPVAGNIVSGSNVINIANTAQTMNVTTTQTVSEETGVVAGPSRYITKAVTLTANQVAEDLNVYISAYRPTGTNFNVYAKIINSADTTPYSKFTWTKLVETSATVGTYSTLANTADYFDIEYGLPVSYVSPASIGVSTVVGDNIINLSSVSQDSALQPGAFVYIQDNTSTSFNVSQINAVANNTSLTLSSNATFTSSNVTLGVIPNLTINTGAFKFTANNGVVRYMQSGSQIFDTFKTFAIKIVPTSTVSNIIPTAANMRTIALQV